MVRRHHFNHFQLPFWFLLITKFDPMSGSYVLNDTYELQMYDMQHFVITTEDFHLLEDKMSTQCEYAEILRFLGRAFDAQVVEYRQDGKDESARDVVAVTQLEKMKKLTQQCDNRFAIAIHQIVEAKNHQLHKAAFYHSLVDCVENRLIVEETQCIEAELKATHCY